VVQLHLDDLTQVCVHVLHHQVEIVELVQTALGRVRIQQFDYLTRHKGVRVK